ncbi:quinone-dependent dihydroorotate dehydrogenase [Pasteurella atlantica]|uniref:quinone-dependent dihydroorotate dehydrogenase n=1 Tax=Pasteurellaceae TaxID=712 RepID=UPI0027608BD5|nr:quinone-dependent dihydroorotate dehydrogenase [Pasteurella atlantica]MDP8098862.1 quinone-dependent dihydroorotate dehydrogenase [Pasteurella atlantica]MDP8106889.1 quinone-dependent dihydroorotate dehydrogenase [Pasteurella atlantica]MDP8116579.1 quinone-dependent dihydroorotate dehydrogenase [Pasteurella atlantica]
MYKKIIRPIIFLFDPETAHFIIFSFIKFIYKIPFFSFLIRKISILENPKLEKKILGLTFKNPVGLAAGLDKNATLYNELADFGFGFIEIGTVTPKAQSGNPKKRLFRLLDDQGIINRMGFNNDGLEAVITQLKKNKHNVIIGGNIGKNTATKPENYTQDYVVCFKDLHPYVDYFTLNISCPNVSSHKKLADIHYLKELILILQKINYQFEIQRPILLKISPDLSKQQLDEIIKLILETNIAGVVATNTSINRDNLKTKISELENISDGGLSGQPIKDRSTQIIQYLAKKSNKGFVIIGVGGIHSEQDALEKLQAGADLIQIYTGFIYEGIGLVKRINQAILNNKKD